MTKEFVRKEFGVRSTTTTTTTNYTRKYFVIKKQRIVIRVEGL